ncbi:MAG TPA: polysaccharide deacetylase family protein [Thermoanaerobaculia bacterium]|nr:polysaccharide deacetylase family protein [Thermoanaerobaculia bacterium]
MSAAGAAVRTARALCRVGTRLLPRGRPGVTILAYHLVGAGTGSPVDLPVKVFRRQMEELQEGDSPVVPCREAVAALERGEPLEGDRVVVTFDDAFRNFAEVAYPVLAELGLPATLFVPTGFVDGSCPAPLAGAEHLPAASWQALRDLADGGLVELGSHSRSHPDLRAVQGARLADEIAGSKAVLEDRTGREPVVFCYPRALRSRQAEAAVRASYRGAVVGGGRKSRPGATSPFRMNRVSLRRGMPTSLAPILDAGLVLEEWAAERWRGRRRPGRDVS